MHTSWVVNSSWLVKICKLQIQASVSSLLFVFSTFFLVTPSDKFLNVKTNSKVLSKKKDRTTMGKDPEVIPTLYKFYTNFNSKEILVSY
jgi:hypothetical protein